MNVLIVDDDRFVVAALKNGLNWSDLGFTGIYCAYGVNEAMTMIENNAIDLLLSDIDMPNGSGLDLLSWIRIHYQNMPVIFLTNYANFEYAQKAIELSCFHYFLKPIDYNKLTEIIRSATVHITKQNIPPQILYEHFWYEFVHEKISDEQNMLEQYIIRMQLAYTKTDVFLPIMFHLFPYHLTADNELKNSLSQVKQLDFVKATFQATFADQFRPKDIFIEYDHSSYQFLAIFSLDSNDVPPLLSMYCETFVELIYKQTHCMLNCFIGLPSGFSLFRFNFQRLCDMMRNSLAYKCHIYELAHYNPSTSSCPAIDSRILEHYLDSAQYPSFMNTCLQYLNELAKNGHLHQKSFISFQADISQLIFSFLKNKGISANEFFQDRTYHILSENAKSSLYYMEMYLHYLTTTIQRHLEKEDQNKSIAKSIKAYLDRHYAENISRNYITEVFFLDYNYGSKIFKRETGFSFKNYIIKKRIEAAKDLLCHTEFSISSIASKVGYDNYSYFSRIFRKETGMTPVEYRKRNPIHKG